MPKSTVRFAVAIDEYIVGLDVAMDDQAVMRVRNRLADAEENLHARIQIRLRASHPLRQWLTIDVLHDEVGSPVRTEPAIEQVRDMRMHQSRQDCRSDGNARYRSRIHACA